MLHFKHVEEQRKYERSIQYIIIYIYIYAYMSLNRHARKGSFPNAFRQHASKSIKQENINRFAWTLLSRPYLIQINPVANFWPGCSSKPGIKFSWVHSDLNKIIGRSGCGFSRRTVQAGKKSKKLLSYDNGGQGFLKAPSLLHANDVAFVDQKTNDKGYWISNVKKS